MEETLKTTPGRIVQGQLIAAFFLQANVMSLTGGTERGSHKGHSSKKGESHGTLEGLLPHPLSCPQHHSAPPQPALDKHCGSLHCMLALCK